MTETWKDRVPGLATSPADKRKTDSSKDADRSKYSVSHVKGVFHFSLGELALVRVVVLIRRFVTIEDT